MLQTPSSYLNCNHTTTIFNPYATISLLGQQVLLGMFTASTILLILFTCFTLIIPPKRQPSRRRRQQQRQNKTLLGRTLLIFLTTAVAILPLSFLGFEALFRVLSNSAWLQDLGNSLRNTERSWAVANSHWIGLCLGMVVYYFLAFRQDLWN